VKEKCVMLIVNGLVVAASVAGLVGGAYDAARTPISLVHNASAPAHTASAHWPVAAERGTVAGVLRRLQDPPPPFFGEHTCVRITTDGVRIHTTYNLSSAVLGLAYAGDLFKIGDWPLGGWAQGTDLRNGVHGWVACQFVELRLMTC
jgi:hypothetical protein